MESGEFALGLVANNTRYDVRFFRSQTGCKCISANIVGRRKVLPQLIEDMTFFKGNCYESYGATETLTHIAVRSITPNPTYFRLLPGVNVTEKNEGIVIHDDVTNIQTSLKDAIHFMNEKDFEVLGRLDDVINSGGVKIHPLLVEELLSRCTSLPFYITQSPDDLWGNAVTLVVIESDMMHWKSLNLKMIFEDHPNWKPKRMIGVQKMDRNENGKIIRKINPDGLVNSL